jgi:hypothetical protein
MASFFVELVEVQFDLFDELRGRVITPLYQQKRFIMAGTDMVEETTGQRPIGYNCNWLRRSPNTLSLLQDVM